MAIQKTEALVLRRFPIRETSLIAVFFSPTHGKFNGILKGIRKDPKKFASSVDLFTLNEVVFYPSRRSNLHLISQCNLIKYCLSKADRRDYWMAGKMMNLVDKVSPANQPNPELFLTLLDCLKQVGRVDPALLVRTFRIRLLALVGFRPYIDGCLVCMRRGMSQVWFSHQEGGLLCDRCKDRDSSAIRISPGIVKAMRMIETLPLTKALSVKLSWKDEKMLRNIVESFIRYHVSS